MTMFCYQCQETANGEACTHTGACGKTDDVAALQDLLVYVTKGISVHSTRARELGIVDADADHFVTDALFAAVTNTNFDAQRIVALIQRGLGLRDCLRTRAGERSTAAASESEEDLPEAASWLPAIGDPTELVAKGRTVGIRSDEDLDEDVRSLRELLIYGLKGMAPYLIHARVLGYEQQEMYDFMQRALAFTTTDASVDELVSIVLECGRVGAQVLALLDEANTTTYGHPEPTDVNIGVVDGPAILVTGHDLHDLEELLKQTEGKGVNVYTHGEMLPANAYPGLNKYPHLVGNYGGSWWRQRDEFESFRGAILATTNCLTPPKKSYVDRIFVAGLVGRSGVRHIPPSVNGSPIDFGPVIARALELEGPEPLEQGTIPIGFARNTVLSVADKVIAAIQAGAIKRFVVMAGCDGRHHSRDYFTQIAEQLPDDTIILTAGCAKYRYNKLGLGDIGGIPRVLDAGQCNDSYSLVAIAQALAAVLGIDDLNDLPIEYDIAWYEQKAVLVLLVLLALGIKRIRLGPTLPAFLSPNVVKVLVDNFDIRPTTSVEQDLESILAGT